MIEQQTKWNPDVMILPSLNRCAHAQRAAEMLVCGDLPAEQRENAETALCVARAFCGLSDDASSLIFDMVVNGDADKESWQPRLAALRIADWFDYEPLAQESDPTFTVERDMHKVLGLEGEVLEAYRHAVQALRALPPLPPKPELMKPEAPTPDPNDPALPQNKALSFAAAILEAIPEARKKGAPVFVHEVEPGEWGKSDTQPEGASCVRVTPEGDLLPIGRARDV